MTKSIEINGEIYAIHVMASDVKPGSEWYGNQIESLQAQRMNYPKGKSFRPHRHILNPRTIKRTQEAFIVISGRIAVDIYDNKSQFIETIEACAGEAVLVYRGGHGIRILEDAVMYEVKSGQFSLVSEDKIFLND